MFSCHGTRPWIKCCHFVWTFFFFDFSSFGSIANNHLGFDLIELSKWLSKNEWLEKYSLCYCKIIDLSLTWGAKTGYDKLTRHI